MLTAGMHDRRLRHAVLLASGSAAVVLPMLQERKLDGPEALVVIAQVTVAGVATILAVPIVLQPSLVGLLASCVLLTRLLLRDLRAHPANFPAARVRRVPV